MNPDVFVYGNILVKLAYVQKCNGFPIIEVFENTQEAQKGEWSVYGPNYEDSHRISFRNLDEIRTVEIKDVIYEIKFEKHENEKYKYPKLTEVIDVFQFAISKKANNI